MNNISRNLAVAACATVAMGSLAACGSGGSSANPPASHKSSGGSSMSGGGSASASLVGPGCAAYAKMVPSGAGSVGGMAKAKVAEAASANPLLETLVAAVSGKVNKKVNLVNALDGGQYTVFAPVDKAFAALGKPTLTKLATPAGAKTLATVLEYHVIKGQLSPSMIDGTHTTLNGQKLKVTGSGNNLTVNGVSHVICGGVKTANATVYMIDQVLMPKKM